MKVTINADDPSLLGSGAMLAKLFHDAGHSLCGYVLGGGYSADARRTKEGHIVVNIYQPDALKGEPQ